MCSFEEEKGNARADVGHDGIVNIKHELTPIFSLKCCGSSIRSS